MAAPRPMTDLRNWRFALARVHPDVWRSDDHFCWLSEVRDHVVCSEGREGGSGTGRLAPRPAGAMRAA